MKNQRTVVTHTEILCYAIEELKRKWIIAKDHAKELEPKNPEFAKVYLESVPWKEKLETLLQLYRIETGEDYGLDIEL